MVRQSTDSGWLSRPSEVFTDTGRVDLFNDPPWDSIPQQPSSRNMADVVMDIAKRGVDLVRRVLIKQGQHSRKVV
jgi:hypothetical protein